VRVPSLMQEPTAAGVASRWRSVAIWPRAGVSAAATAAQPVRRGKRRSPPRIAPHTRACLSVPAPPTLQPDGRSARPHIHSPHHQSGHDPTAAIGCAANHRQIGIDPQRPVRLGDSQIDMLRHQLSLDGDEPRGRSGSPDIRRWPASTPQADRNAILSAKQNRSTLF